MKNKTYGYGNDALNVVSYPMPPYDTGFVIHERTQVLSDLSMLSGGLNYHK